MTGSTVALTIDVTSPAGTPVGVVDIAVDGVAVASPVLVNGRATWSFARYARGLHQVTVVFRGANPRGGGSTWGGSSGTFWFAVE